MNLKIDRAVKAAIVVLPLFIAACGGNSQTTAPLPPVVKKPTPPPPPVKTPSPPPPAPQPPLAGIWTWTQAAPGTMTGILLSDGTNFYYETVVTSCTGYYAGTLSDSKGAVTGNGVFVPSDPNMCGVGLETDTFTGQLTSATALTLSSVNGTNEFSIDWQADTALYAVPGNLKSVAGNWLLSDGAILNITDTGALFEQDPVTGCVVNGTVTVVDATYNLYSVKVSFASCTGNDSVLNGQETTGLLSYINNTNVLSLLGGVTVAQSIYTFDSVHN